MLPFRFPKKRGYQLPPQKKARATPKKRRHPIWVKYTIFHQAETCGGWGTIPHINRTFGVNSVRQGRYNSPRPNMCVIPPPKKKRKKKSYQHQKKHPPHVPKKNGAAVLTAPRPKRASSRLSFWKSSWGALALPSHLVGPGGELSEGQPGLPSAG